jgi:hypothetical protein
MGVGCGLTPNPTNKLFAANPNYGCSDLSGRTISKLDHKTKQRKNQQFWKN